MEFFDVVDEHDRVVSQLSRDEVHQRRLRHRAVHVFLFRTDGRLLIHRRSKFKEEFPSVWTSSATGHVSAGETYDTAVRRELNEELSVGAPLQRLRKFEAVPDSSMEFTVLYQAVSDERVVADETEIAETRWLTAGEIAEWLERQPELFAPVFRILFRWYQANAEKLPRK